MRKSRKKILILLFLTAAIIYFFLFGFRFPPQVDEEDVIHGPFPECEITKFGSIEEFMKERGYTNCSQIDETGSYKFESPCDDFNNVSRQKEAGFQIAEKVTFRCYGKGSDYKHEMVLFRTEDNRLLIFSFIA